MNLQENWTQCSVHECTRKARTRFGELCEAHYYRRRRGTSSERPIWDREIGSRVTGTALKTSHGYLLVYSPNHALADAVGNVYQHRQVLFDEIGEGPHDCHWCGQTVDWAGVNGKRIDVDHVDGDKSNNDLGNLVPSCHRCNSLRSLP